MYVPDEGSLLPKYRDCTTSNFFELYLMCCGVMLLILITCIYIYIHNIAVHIIICRFQSTLLLKYANHCRNRKVQFRHRFAYSNNNIDSKRYIIIRTAILYNEINSGQIMKNTK